MINIEVLKQMTSQFQMIESERKALENQAIIPILKLFGITEHKSTNLKSIPDFLEKDNIFILVPKNIFEGIDFSILNIPAKVKFQENIYEDKYQIIGVDNFKQERLELKFDSDTEARFRPLMLF